MKKNKISKDDIKKMMCSFSFARMLGIFDWYTLLITSPRTFDYLLKQEYPYITDKLRKLLMYEHNSNTPLFVKEAEKMYKEIKNQTIRRLIRLIVRKHLIFCPMDRRLKQSIIDKFFDKSAHKSFLLESR